MKLQQVRARFANSADLEPLYQHLQSRIASLSIWIQVELIGGTSGVWVF